MQPPSKCLPVYFKAQSYQPKKVSCLFTFSPLARYSLLKFLKQILCERSEPSLLQFEANVCQSIAKVKAIGLRMSAVCLLSVNESSANGSFTRKRTEYMQPPSQLVNVCQSISKLRATSLRKSAVCLLSVNQQDIHC